MKSAITALFLLIAWPAHADESRPMLVPQAVVERGDGWVTLVYPAITLEVGEPEAIMLCLRAVRHHMASAPSVHWAPEDGATPVDSPDGLRRANPIKRNVIISPAGFQPVGENPYYTIRAENMTTDPLGVSFRVNVRHD